MTLPIYESWDSIAGVFLKMMGKKRDGNPAAHSLPTVLGTTAAQAE